MGLEVEGGAGRAGRRAGRIFNVQRYSLQDGPGLRTTVFLKGCPLSCAWCHNPESQAMAPQVVRVEGRCASCRLCEEACPTRLAGPCTLCGACVAACPTGARQRIGRDVEVEALLDEVCRDRIFFDQSGGGVTLSGGEPLAQPDFAEAVLAGLRGRGVHTALDTCGQGRWEDLSRLAAQADVVLYDVKLMDEARHRAATGVANRLILENLRRLGEAHRAIWLRVPLVPGVNDDRANLDATARLAAATPGVRRVDLLPYHATGVAKAARVGVKVLAAVPPTPEAAEAAAAPFRSLGLETHVGGSP